MPRKKTAPQRFPFQYEKDGRTIDAEFERDGPMVRAHYRGRASTWTQVGNSGAQIVARMLLREILDRITMEEIEEAIRAELPDSGVEHRGYGRAQGARFRISNGEPWELHFPMETLMDFPIDELRTKAADAVRYREHHPGFNVSFDAEGFPIATSPSNPQHHWT